MKRFIVIEIFSLFVAGVFFLYFLLCINNFIYYFGSAADGSTSMEPLITRYRIYSVLSFFVFAFSLTAGILIAIKELSVFSSCGISKTKKMLLTVFSELCFLLILIGCSFFAYFYLEMLTSLSFSGSWLGTYSAIQTLIYGLLFVICGILIIAAGVLSLLKSQPFFGKLPKPERQRIARERKKEKLKKQLDELNEKGSD